MLRSISDERQGIFCALLTRPITLFSVLEVCIGRHFRSRHYLGRQVIDIQPIMLGIIHPIFKTFLIIVIPIFTIRPMRRWIMSLSPISIRFMDLILLILLLLQTLASLYRPLKLFGQQIMSRLTSEIINIILSFICRCLSIQRLLLPIRTASLLVRYLIRIHLRILVRT